MHFTGNLRAATFPSLAAWLALGFFAASIAQQRKPKNDVLNVPNSGELDLHAPLRGRGILGDEPATLRWGIWYEIELASFDYQMSSFSVQGGSTARTETFYGCKLS